MLIPNSKLGGQPWALALEFRRMTKNACSLASLAAEENPLDTLDATVSCLKRATAESRHLEWKSCGLFGRNIAPRTKYRAVKAALSFANTEGGFLVFGVDAQGTWVGLTPDDLREFDPAKVTELISGVVFPELPAINYAQFKDDSRDFVVVHIPPSPIVPHATTKEIVVAGEQGAKQVVIAKHAVYYRHGAKSDTATPFQLQKLVERRTIHVRDELVRRVREVPVPVLAQGGTRGAPGGTAVTVAKVTNDPSAPLVRLTRAAGQTSGILLHEELSDGLFDEINNVLDANELLAGGAGQFVLGEEVYYRVYAERHHVETTEGHARLLLRTGLRNLYAPCLFWVPRVDTSVAAEVLLGSIRSPKHPLVLSALRVIVLFGGEATSWLERELDGSCGGLAQPPEYYWTFKKIVKRTQADRRLVAMRTTTTAVLEIPEKGAVEVGHLLASPQETAGYLSRVCLRIFHGEDSLRGLARQLDVAAHGKEVEDSGKQIWPMLKALAASRGSRTAMS